VHTEGAAQCLGDYAEMWGIVDQKEESVDKVQGTNGKCVEMDGCVHVCVHMLKSTQYLPLILYICVHEFRAQNR
jgi:hypothetical protein